MKRGSSAVPKLTTGLDVGDRWTALCAVDETGAAIERGRIATTPAGVERRFRQGPVQRIVLEAGKQSPWMSRLLASWGHEVIVANPRRVRLIAAAANKDDPRDAETLARLGRLDPQLLQPITHRSAEAQQDLAVVRARDALVRSRTLLINHVRGVVKSLGSRVPRCSAHAFARQADRVVPDALRPALAPMIAIIEQLTGEIRRQTRAIEALVQTRYPEALPLQQVKGVGPITALAYVLVLEDPTRFATARSVGPYLGLVPRRRQSSRADPQLRITKTGDGLLRRLLVQSAHYVLGPFGPECDLRGYGERISARGGKNAKKRAVVAVARKLSAVLYHLWVTGEAYEPGHGAAPKVAA